MEPSSSGSAMARSSGVDPFDIPAKGNPVEQLRRWRQAALVLNSSRRFRYMLDLKKEEQKEEVRRKIRAQAHCIRAAFRFKEAARVNDQPKEIKDTTATSKITQVEKLIKEKRFEELEDYLKSHIISEGHHDLCRDHPQLFLLVRKASVLNLSLFDAVTARWFFENEIKAPLLALWSDQMVHRNAVKDDLDAELATIDSILISRASTGGDFDPATDGLVSELIIDYLRLYVPNRIGFNDGRRNITGLWQMAYEISRRNRRSTFRCLVCSKLFRSSTIGVLQAHLDDECKGSKSPYVCDLIESCKAKTPTKGKGPINEQTTGNTSQKRRRMSLESDGKMDLPSCILEKIYGEAECLMDEMDRQVAGVSDTQKKMKGVLKTMKMLVSSVAKAGGSTAYEQDHTTARTNEVDGHRIPAVRSTYEQDHTTARTDEMDGEGIPAVRSTYEQDHTTARTDEADGQGIPAVRSTAGLHHYDPFEVYASKDDTILNAGGMTSVTDVDAPGPCNYFNWPPGPYADNWTDEDLNSLIMENIPSDAVAKLDLYLGGMQPEDKAANDN